MLWAWFAAFIILIIIEAIGPRLETIWFAAGSLCALVLAAFGVSFWIQLLVFVVVSVAALILTRPLVKKFKSTANSNLNANKFIGKGAVVTEDIDNTTGKGKIISDGQIWSAKSIDNSKIVKNTIVKIKEISGVKAVVENIERY